LFIFRVTIHIEDEPDTAAIKNKQKLI